MTCFRYQIGGGPTCLITYEQEHIWALYIDDQRIMGASTVEGCLGAIHINRANLYAYEEWRDSIPGKLAEWDEVPC